MMGVVCRSMTGYIVVAVVLARVHYVHSASRGQRVLSSPDIPVTKFTCAGRPPGYYADLETGCQVYHMCTEGGNQFVYRCPNTTLFQQRMLICAHWYQVNCSRSEQHYDANLLIGQRDKFFVDDPSTGGKKVTSLQNPDLLQNLGQQQDSSSKTKARGGSENSQSSGIFQYNFKRVGGSSLGLDGKKTFSSTSPFTAVTPGKSSEDLSSLPLAGSVLPGGLIGVQNRNPPARGNQFIQAGLSSQQSLSTQRFGFSSTARVTQPISFTPNTTPKYTSQLKTTLSTKPSDRFSTQVSVKPITFQPVSFQSEPTSGFQSPSDQKQDLAVASQENALSSKFSTMPLNLELGEDVPNTNTKAFIEPTKNGSLPDDKYNTFIKRFNPYEEEPTQTEVTAEKSPGNHVFINRFVPPFEQSVPQSEHENSEKHIFINRFVLTPEEINREKNRQNGDQVHAVLPPDEQLQVNFPTFDLLPPLGDSDDSESNKIELHLQDARRNLFIPDEGSNEFSKTDAAPIVVSIPLHSIQNMPPMWFRSEKSDDPCGRCHPAFITNKNTCLPCVIVR